MKPSVSFLFTVCFIGHVSLFAQQTSIKKIDRAISVKVDTFILNKMQALHIPGLSLAVMRNGEIIYSKGYGFSNLEHKVAAADSTVYLIGSTTKPFVATGIMMLMEKGRLSLLDPVSKYVADLPTHWQPLTIKQLLSHTSGIRKNRSISIEKGPDYDPATACKFDYDPQHYTLRDRLKEDMCLPLQFTPGEHFLYSGTGYLLLGLVIEKVSGMGLEAFLKKQIFDPLLMKETRMLNNELLIPNRAAGYKWINGQFTNVPPEDPQIMLADGGVVSTVTNMAKWDAALGTDKLLKRETLQMMFAPTKIKDSLTVYGLGFALRPYQGHRRVGHWGGSPGFRSAFSRFIDDKIGIIVLINSDQDVNLGDISNQVAAFYFER